MFKKTIDKIINICYNINVKKLIRSYLFLKKLLNFLKNFLTKTKKYAIIINVKRR